MCRIKVHSKKKKKNRKNNPIPRPPPPPKKNQKHLSQTILQSKKIAHLTSLWFLLPGLCFHILS